MKRLAVLFAVLAFLCSPLLSVAQDKPAGPPITGSLQGYLGWVENWMTRAVDAMPADKIDFAPSPSQGEFKGVRTFADQIRHCAAANYVEAAAILGEKPPVELKGEDFVKPPKTKDELVASLKDSFAYLHKALASITEQNAFADIQDPYNPNGKTSRAAIGIGAVAHPWDHYGQMVVYLRMNGIIPPASRPKEKK